VSYARFGWEGSNVYVFFNTDHMLECCGCSLRAGRERIEFATVDEMVAHLGYHEHAGHTVPASCYEGMRDDRERGELR
jgi:hypothetical protein